MREEQIFNGLSEEEFVAVMHELGFAAELVRAANGHAYIKALMGQMWFIVHFFSGPDETNQTVASIATVVDLRLPFQFHNRWNRVHLFPKSIVGAHGETILEMDVVLRGVTRAYLKRCFIIWHNAVLLYLEDAHDVLTNSPAGEPLMANSDGI